MRGRGGGYGQRVHVPQPPTLANAAPAIGEAAHAAAQASTQSIYGAAPGGGLGAAQGAGAVPAAKIQTSASATVPALEASGVLAPANAMVIHAIPDQAKDQTNKSISAVPTQKGINPDIQNRLLEELKKRKTHRIVIVAAPKVILFMNAMLFYVVKFAMVTTTKSCAQI
jgi:hypothetical protein